MRKLMIDNLLSERSIDAERKKEIDRANKKAFKKLGNLAKEFFKRYGTTEPECDSLSSRYFQHISYQEYKAGRWAPPAGKRYFQLGFMIGQQHPFSKD